MNPRASLLIGSAKHPHSNSASLGGYLMERLRERGHESETMLLHESLWTEERRNALTAAVDRADVLVLAFPLYVDTLPYLVIKALELLAEHQRTNADGKPRRLVSIVNCGLPDAQHCAIATAICRQFAREAGYEWLGGLALGAGEAIGGRPLRKLGGMARNAVRALDLTAEAIAAGRPVPQQAIDLMAKPLIPAWLYAFVANRSWHKLAKKHGAQGKLLDRPYTYTDGAKLGKIPN